MDNFDAHLFVKKSGIPGAGKGLFTKVLIPKGSCITEYTGKITTWKNADHDDGNNLYIYYITRNYVIDGRGSNALAQYANDGSGFKKIKGIRNNCRFAEQKKQVFLHAIRIIQPGEEILVPYGKEYWDVIKKNGIM